MILYKIGGRTVGNIISLKTCEQHISMSNGLTDVFISTLGLSGTYLAKTDDEKRIIIWLLEKDQSAIGGGSVCFDICDMPWNIANFKEMKCFLLNVIEGAKKRVGWEFLGYQPNEKLLFPCLNQFYKLITNTDTSMLNQVAAQEWLNDTMEIPNDPVVCGYPRCKKHPIFLTVFGCYLCNN